MNNSIFFFLVFFILSAPLIGQQFDDRQVLFETKGSKSVVYTKEFYDTIYFIEQNEYEVYLSSYVNDTIKDLGNIGQLGASEIVDLLDINKDGLVDVLGNERILLANGDGTFEKIQIPIEGLPREFILRHTDINNDGVYDLLMQKDDYTYPFESTLEMYFLNYFNEIIDIHSFTILDLYGPPEIYAKNVFDLNSSGNLDLVYLHLRNLYIQTNNGDGTFDEQKIRLENWDWQSLPIAVIADDFDGDNDLDIVVYSFRDTDAFFLFNQNGVFTNENILWDTDGYLMCLKSGDLNEDDIVDIAYLESTDNFDSVAVKIVYGLSDGTFISPVTIDKMSYKNYAPSSVYLLHGSENFMTIFDYDKDGDVDILVNALKEEQYLVYENLKTSVSVSDIIETSTLNLYPNPSKDYIHIESDSELKKVIITDPSGMILSQTNYKNKLDISFLPNGIYYVKAIDSDGENLVSNFLKVD